MNYLVQKREYEAHLKKAAKDSGLSVQQFLDRVVNTAYVRVHTIEIAEMIHGYKLMAEINSELAQEGLLDIYGDKKR